MHLSPYGTRNSKFFSKWPDLLFTPRPFLRNFAPIFPTAKSVDGSQYSSKTAGGPTTVLNDRTNVLNPAPIL
jgi:hypothetical protein